MRYLATLVAAFVLILLLVPPTHAAAPKVPILMYHYIGNNPNPKDTARDTLSVTPDKFEAQMSYLQQHGYTSISLDTLAAIYNGQTAAPTHPIVLTFDDGYIDFYLNAYPILRKYSMKVVSFIPTGLIGSGYYMNWNQIKEIQASGVATFEAHSISHGTLTKLSSKQLIKEVTESKQVLVTQTGYPVNFFAYPFGISNNTVIAQVKKAGYVGALGTWYGKATGINFNMPRIRITGQMDLKSFAKQL